MADTHDLVIRMITKYLYRENPTLVNLHLINRRYYGLRRVFEKQLAYVSIHFSTIFGIKNSDLYFTFISKTIRYQERLIQPNRFTQNEWIDYRDEVLRQVNDTNTSSNYLDGNRIVWWNARLSRKFFGKQLAECISLIIKKYDDGELP